MATQLTLRAKPISRPLLAQICKTPELLKAFENLFFDVAVTIPDNVVDNSQAIADAAAAAAAAQGTASAAQITATAAQITAGSALSAANTAQATVDALALRDAPVSLIDGPTITPDASQRNSFGVTLGGNRTLAAPIGLSGGMLLSFALRQDATGSRTLAFNAIYDFGAAGAPTLSTAANAVDYAFGYYDAPSGKLLMIFRRGTAVASTAATFSAHNNGTAQSIPNGTITKVNLSTTAFDIGTKFASSRWTPGARTISMCGAVYIPGGKSVTCAIYKNGAVFKWGSLSVGAVAGETSVVSAFDVAIATDYYELFVVHGTGSAQNTDGGAAVTYFQGTTVSS